MSETLVLWPRGEVLAFIYHNEICICYYLLIIIIIISSFCASAARCWRLFGKALMWLVGNWRFMEQGTHFSIKINVVGHSLLTIGKCSSCHHGATPCERRCEVPRNRIACAALRCGARSNAKVCVCVCALCFCICGGGVGWLVSECVGVWVVISGPFLKKFPCNHIINIYI